jgi:dolichol-phosphate hexosyltransferase
MHNIKKRAPKKLAVIIPCHNDEKGLGDVLLAIPRITFARMGIKVDVIVVDNNSSDKTLSIAKKKRARVIIEPREGRGYSILTGFKNLAADTDYVVLIDGDGSYKASEMFRIVEPLHSGFADAVVGSRFGGDWTRMPFLNMTGNWAFSLLVRFAYHKNISDVFSGYFAWNKWVADALTRHMTVSGSAMDMITKMVRLQYKVVTVPVSYDTKVIPKAGETLKSWAIALRIWAGNLGWGHDDDDEARMLPSFKDVESGLNFKARKDRLKDEIL